MEKHLYNYAVTRSRQLGHDAQLSVLDLIIILLFQTIPQ